MMCLPLSGISTPAERSDLVVVLDALDEAKTPREIARRLLVPLARDLGVQSARRNPAGPRRGVAGGLR